MKHFILLSFLILILHTACAPCTKRVNCPAYDGTFLYSWFPYWQQDIPYIYSNGTDLDTMFLDYTEESKPYEYKEGDTKGFGSDGVYDCNKYGIIQSKISVEHPRWLNTRIHHIASTEDGDTPQQVVIKINNYEVALYVELGNPTSPLEQDSITSYRTYYYNEIILNRVTYNDVITVTTVHADTAAKEQIDILYIAKGKGIIGYHIFNNPRTYWLQ